MPKFEIFIERFFVATEAEAVDPSATHEVKFARSGRASVWSGKDGDLLKFGEAQGLELPSGCRTGQCESCAVRVLSGRVRHLIPVEIDDPELCLTCQAVPASDLVLDV